MGDGSLAFESEHLRFELQLKRFMTYRPTARAVFYREGSILLGIHKENGVFTLPGGRFDQAKDLIPGLTLVECLYNETLHREVKEELGIRPYSLSESRNSHIGYTLWRHPDTNTPCFEVIYAIQWDPTPSVPISSELENPKWFSFTDINATPYKNVQLAMRLFDLIWNNSFYVAENHIIYDPNQFSSGELALILTDIGSIMNTVVPGGYEVGHIRENIVVDES